MDTLHTERDDLGVLVQQTRERFNAGDYSAALESFQALGDISKVRSGLRVEAISFAARSHAALGQREKGREIMKRLGRPVWTTRNLYKQAAIAYLELDEMPRAHELLGVALAL